MNHRNRWVFAALLTGTLSLTGAPAMAEQLNADQPAQGVTASYDQGRLELSSDDGNFSLRPSGLFQFRYLWNYRDGGVDGMDDRSRSEDGVELTRFRLGFDGHVMSPDLTYYFVVASGEPFAIGSGMQVLDAYVTWRVDGPWSVRAGQFKDPMHREFGVHAGRQLAVTRSLADNLIGGSSIGRVQGARVLYEDDGPIRGRVALHQGPGSANTAFDDPAAGASPSGRVEYRLIGDNWRDYGGFSAWDRGELVVIGGGAGWLRFTNADLFHHTVDVQWNNPMDFTGLAVFAAFLGRFDDIDNADNQYHWGGVLQAGYRLDENWELFGRYSITRIDSDVNMPSNTLHEATFGGSYYLHRDHVKVTADLTWLPRGSDADLPAKGILAQSTDDDQLIGRVQVQLEF